MKFNSGIFFLFFLVFFGVYWSLSRRPKLQKVFLLAASYFFYGYWDYRFLLLIILSSAVDFYCGSQMYRQPNRKKLYLYASIILNLGVLCGFKYFNFFSQSFADLLSVLGMHADAFTIQVFLPLGISFYTFQTMSYTLDVYRGKMNPTSSWIDFFNYVSFFPQLVAGPIERANRFLPQFSIRKVFDYDLAVDGTRQVLWGLFKKMVIADYFLAPVVDATFADPGAYSGMELLFGAFYFGFQIYADFSGYSDIAIGLGKMLGFRLTDNFRTPMFSKSIPEFWSRWHISLSRWFMDYVYIPMARKFKHSMSWRYICTIFLFFLIGLWHGANYTYVVFGIIHGLLFLPRLLSKRDKKVKKTLTYLNNDRFGVWISMFGTLFLTNFLLVFFRSPDITFAVDYYAQIFTDIPNMEFIDWWTGKKAKLAILVFMICEWIQREYNHQLAIGHFPKIVRVGIYIFLVGAILLYGDFGSDPFIYFQF